MSVLLKVLIVLWMCLTGGFLGYWLATNLKPARFWRNFFIIRNVFGYMCGAMLFILVLPATIIYYIGYVGMIAFLWIDLLGVKKQFRMMKYGRVDDDSGTV